MLECHNVTEAVTGDPHSHKYIVHLEFSAESDPFQLLLSLGRFSPFQLKFFPLSQLRGSILGSRDFLCTARLYINQLFAPMKGMPPPACVCDTHAYEGRSGIGSTDNLPYM